MKYFVETVHINAGDVETHVPYILDVPKSMSHLNDHQQMLIALAAIQNGVNAKLIHDFDEVDHISFDNPELTEDGSYELEIHYSSSFIKVGKITPDSDDFISKLNQRMRVPTVQLSQHHINTLLCA